MTHPDNDACGGRLFVSTRLPYPGLPLLSILLFMDALTQWTIRPTPVSSKSIRLAMEDRIEETWELPNSYSLSVVAQNNLYYIPINEMAVTVRS